MAPIAQSGACFPNRGKAWHPAQDMWPISRRWGAVSALLAVGAEAAIAAGLVVIDERVFYYQRLLSLLLGWPVVYVFTFAWALAFSAIARSRVLSEAVPGGHRFYPARVLQNGLDWFLETVPGVLLVLVPGGAFLLAMLAMKIGDTILFISSPPAGARCARPPTPSWLGGK